MTVLALSVLLGAGFGLGVFLLVAALRAGGRARAGRSAAGAGAGGRIRRAGWSRGGWV